MNSYRNLNKQVYKIGEYSIVPIRMEDRYDIKKWRNEQMYHLRQQRPLTKNDQDIYFDNVISKLFDQEKPEQILFSYLKDDKCIGYGGLVHINWMDRNAEISFIMDTRLENNHFNFHWQTFLKLIQEIGFSELKLHKIFTYAFDIRPQIYPILENAGFHLEAELKEHCLYKGYFISIKIHSKINHNYYLNLRLATSSDIGKTYEWANNPVIRKFAFNSNTITLNDHSEWILGKLKLPNCEYYILEYDRTPVGSIRFDIEENNTAKINYLIDPNFTRKGFGTIILREGIDKIKKKIPSIKLIYGLVFQENKASVRIFEKLGFELVSHNGNDLRFEINI